MRVLITGGTGFVGQALCPRLAAAGHQVVILTRQSNPSLPEAATTAVTRLDDLAPDEFGAVINLAGAPIGDARWTEPRKKLLLDSRVSTTSRLVEWMGCTRQRPHTLVSASAVGYYGEQGDQPVTEETPPTPGFTHQLCVAWEREAERAGALGVRVCVMRIGVVLDRDGGALAKMLPAFRLGGGGRLGTGRQYFPGSTARTWRRSASGCSTTRRREALTTPAHQRRSPTRISRPRWGGRSLVRRWYPCWRQR